MYWISLLLWFGICFAMAGIGIRLTAAGIAGWYRTSAKPAIAPPVWIYGPVWTLLYALMAIAVWQVWQSEPSPLRSGGITLFIVQLALNLVWSWMFFHEHEIGLALADAILLWAVVGVTTLVFQRITPSAALLMLPYLAWLTFAAFLNVGFWRLNE